ncbi:CAAX protease self-immunity family protein [Rickettsia bellii str. RML Mogi]|uniref:CAAX protease self-immunity family protein n=2 Tax=Rickettsia bellii TaxID=33990 RepID=A0A0F3QJ86_RICBE|nr:CAAX protease self-immunity family protein [Rickettsia bellii str. RML Mogi]
MTPTYLLNNNIFMQALNTTYILLITTIMISLFCSNKRVMYSVMSITVLSAFYQGIINIIGLSALAVFSAITYAYFNFPQLNKVIRTLLFILLSVCFAVFAFHKVPGFFNVIAISNLQLSKASMPFSMYLNFDKVMPALIIFAMSDLSILERSKSERVVKYTLFSLLSCIAIIITLVLVSGYVLFEPKLPDILLIWMINNFFFVCFSEEVFFRGFIQKTLQNLLPKQQMLALVIASLIFGVAHFQGGLTYVILSSTCGFFYGYAYYKTNKILCSMMVHFGLNLSHLLLFTYPALI